MKKIIVALMALALVASCSKESTNEPTPGPTPDPQPSVSTEPTKRVAVIEEYTGINCGYCPDGHKIVNEIIAEFPGQVYGVNIHAGSYAANTYTTNEGTAYLGEAGVSGFPAGVVSRHLFTYTQQGGMAMNRSTFKKAAKEIIAMTSPVNIAATATLEEATRTLTVKVKGFFTSETNGVTSNSLYVDILQDSVIGSQNGASGNPDQKVGNQYRHMHMFRTCITGTWGEEITPVSAGSYFDRTYTYVIPAQLGNKNPIDAVLKDLKVLVFIAEGHKEILTACEPTIVRK